MTQGIYSIHTVPKSMIVGFLNWVLWYFGLVSLANKHILADKGQNSDTYPFLWIIMTVKIANRCQLPQLI